MADKAQVIAVWEQVAGMAKQATVAPNLYRALDRAVPIAWENSQFVVGMDGADGMLLSTLQSGEYQIKIEQALRVVTRDAAIKFRVIDGITPDVWEATKLRDAAAVRLADQQAARQAASSTAAAVENATSWDELYDQIARQWQETPFRTLPSGKGRFLQSALGLLETGLDNIGEPTDQTERLFSRTLERVASLTATDATLLSYLLFERRRLRP